ncbi:MAG: EAL domain-containing protein [Sphingobium sp.]|nr:EAL domain-containing protein [Sphingobium sp.]
MNRLSAPKITASARDMLALVTLMGLGNPARIPDPLRLHRAQLDRSRRTCVARCGLFLVGVACVWLMFGRYSSALALSGWSLAMIALAIRTRCARHGGDGTSRTVRRHGFWAFLNGCAWLAVFPIVMPHASESQLFALWILSSGLMVGAAFGYPALPLASIAFLCSVGFGSAFILHPMMSFGHLALMAGFTLLLLLSNMRQAIDFAARLHTSQRLEEQSEVVSLLLKEFEGSSADWLWQTDTEGSINSVSPRFAQALGQEPSAMEGRSLVGILAKGTEPAGHRSAALVALARKLDNHEAFTDLAVPVEALGGLRWWELSASPRYEDGQFAGFRGVASDVTPQRENADRIAQLARFDMLTNLANRMQVTEALRDALEHVWQSGQRAGFLIIDLDRFKSVNDTLGHQAGDRLLMLVADRLRAVCGDRALCGRLGGDEFAVVIPELSNRLNLNRLALAIIETLSQPYEVDQDTLYIGACVGSAIAPEDGSDAETLIRNADLALYRAKEEGGGRHFCYEPALHHAAQERRHLEMALREALEKDQLHVVFQPVVDAMDGEVVAFESLARWTHPEMGPISPAKFVPVAEEARLISPIGEWVLRNACQEAMNWPPHVRVAVNVSAEQLGRPDFATVVMSALAHSGLPAHRLELEVTESVFMREGTGAVAMLDQLVKLGVRLSLDDFGTGYSSLGYLSRAKFSTIKVDRSFVQGAARNVPESLAIIRAVVAMAQSLDIETTAEGVETAEEVLMISSLGCNKIQGFYFGRPMQAADAQALFAQRNSRVA